MAKEQTKETVKDLIKPTASGEGEPIEYEMEDYANMDSVTEEELDAMESDAGRETAQAEAEEPEQPSETEPDWKAIAERQAAELAQFKTEQDARRQEDLEKRVKELPEEEQVPFLLNYQKEQERARQVETIRQQQMTEFPLASLIFGKVSERFEMELDDPEAYREALSGLDADFNQLVSEIVTERVKQEMEKFYAETGQQWGSQKLGAAQPRPLQPRNPIRNQYEQTRKSILESGKSATAEDLSTLVRQRQRAKG